MAKRYTDNNKWKKTFFKTLPNPYKLLWLYILDDCDHAGIWEINVDYFNFQTGLKCTYDEMVRHFGDKIQLIENNTRLFVPSFIDFQYVVLNPNNRAHSSAFKILEKLGIKTLEKGFTSPSEGYKDKDKDKDNKRESERDFMTHRDTDVFSQVVVAIKRHGSYSGDDAKRQLGDKIWDKIVSIGGWSRVCAMTPRELSFAFK